ncbi:hypothetical protein [Mycobacterium sp. UM_CSW]|uniref:hypothetical protein n=1 Tax=Mycobacterium sp. UM_CSW TaxID=1370119 RepID=UPI00042A5CC7|nr:hypothetical protein [Mycobacterium sp. UM_CSW]
MIKVESRAAPQIYLLADNIGDVVRFAGGWTFDQVCAGFRVAILAKKTGNSQAARILGAQILELREALDNCDERPIAVVVASDLFVTDTNVAKHVRKVIAERTAVVATWGSPGRPFARHAIPVQHRLSTAANLFKRQAFAAAGLSAAPDRVESFIAARRSPSTGVAKVLFTD